MLYDAEAVLVDFEAFLVEDGRASHGTAFLTHKLAELRARHRIDESADRKLLRRFAAGLTDTFLGLLPREARPTDDPLTAGDPTGTLAAMDGGGDTDHPKGDACPSKHQSSRPRAPART